MRFGAQKKLRFLSERIQNTLEIPETAQSGTAQIELSGNREALIDGCRGILQYEDASIRLRAGQLIVRFTGSGLRICVMQNDQVRITGTIAAVDFTS